MNRPKLILAIGLTEILIGCVTLVATTISLVLSWNIKSPNVLAFVIVSASISTLLGTFLLSLNKLARDLLIYFSSVVVLSKFLIFAEIVRLNGALELSIPDPIKNGFSIAYHVFVIYYLMRPDIRKLFIK